MYWLLYDFSGFNISLSKHCSHCSIANVFEGTVTVTWPELVTWPSMVLKQNLSNSAEMVPNTAWKNRWYYYPLLFLSSKDLREWLSRFSSRFKANVYKLWCIYVVSIPSNKIIIENMIGTSSPCCFVSVSNIFASNQPEISCFSRTME